MYKYTHRYSSIYVYIHIYAIDPACAHARNVVSRQCREQVEARSGSDAAARWLNPEHAGCEDFALMSKEDAFEAMDYLEASRDTDRKGVFEEKQKNIGFKENKAASCSSGTCEISFPWNKTGSTFCITITTMES